MRRCLRRKRSNPLFDIMNYYRSALNLLYDYAATHSGDLIERDAIYNELMDAALDIATTLISWGVSDDYAFWLASRRVTGNL